MDVFTTSINWCPLPQDQDRFTNFIATSHVNAPSSLHLQMKELSLSVFGLVKLGKPWSLKRC